MSLGFAIGTHKKLYRLIKTGHEERFICYSPGDLTTGFCRKKIYIYIYMQCKIRAVSLVTAAVKLRICRQFAFLLIKVKATQHV